MQHITENVSRRNAKAANKTITTKETLPTLQIAGMFEALILRVPQGVKVIKWKKTKSTIKRKRTP